jgi:hypothetical protein
MKGREMPQQILTLALVDEGRLLAAMDCAIERIGGKVIQCYGDHDDPSIAKGEISLKIKISKDPKYDRFFRLEWDVQEKEPKQPAGSSTFATAHHGKLMSQNSGTSAENPNQENFLSKLDDSDSAK